MAFDILIGGVGDAFSESEAPLDVDDLDAVYLTHLHGDHVNGLEMTLASLASVPGTCELAQQNGADPKTEPTKPG